MPDRANRQPSGSARSATGHRFGTRRLRELLAARGDAGLWLAEDDDGGETLLRLYPGLPTLEEWHALELAASQLVYVVDSRLVPIEADRARRLAAPELRLPGRRVAGATDRPRADGARSGGRDVRGRHGRTRRARTRRRASRRRQSRGHRARRRAGTAAPRRRAAGRHARARVRRSRPCRARACGCDRRPSAGRPRRAPGAASSDRGEHDLRAGVDRRCRDPGAAAQPVRRAERLRRRRCPRSSSRCCAAASPSSPSERYGTPAALVEALGDAIGVDLRAQRRERAPRATRARGARAAVARRRTRPGRRRVGIAIPAAAVLVAAAIGTVAGSATTAPDPPAAVTLAGAGLSVEAPRGWLRGGAGEGPPAIGAPALVAHPPGRSSATALVVTRAAAPLLAKLADAVPEPVRLGDHDAWRYRDVAVDAESVADVYVLEDGDGPIVAACLGPSDAPASVRAAVLRRPHDVAPRRRSGRCARWRRCGTARACARRGGPRPSARERAPCTGGRGDGAAAGRSGGPPGRRVRARRRRRREDRDGRRARRPAAPRRPAGGDRPGLRRARDGGARDAPHGLRAGARARRRARACAATRTSPRSPRRARAPENPQRGTRARACVASLRTARELRWRRP